MRYDEDRESRTSKIAGRRGPGLDFHSRGRGRAYSDPDRRRRCFSLTTLLIIGIMLLFRHQPARLAARWNCRSAKCHHRCAALDPNKGRAGPCDIPGYRAAAAGEEQG